MRELYIDGEDIDYTKVLTPINGNSIGKHLLSMTQLTKSDVENYINETYAAESVFEDGVDLLPRKRLFALMRQPSTRTGGGFAQAMIKLGGHGQHQGGVENSSEAKKETPFDSEVAFATQTDIYAVRTEEVMGPAFAAYAMQLELDRGNLSKFVPVLNAGDGTNEHPTQTLGDYFTIHKEFGRLSGINTLLIGDYPRYRAHISYMIGAATVGMNVYVVESEVAPVPEYLCKLLGDKLHKLDRIEDALDIVDVVYPGRKPEEYDGEDYNEKRRSSILAADYQNWAINQQKLNLMSQNAIILHARPRGFELPTETDGDDRRRDVQQMEDVIKARMAIIALHMGRSIIGHLKEKES